MPGLPQVDSLGMLGVEDDWIQCGRFGALLVDLNLRTSAFHPLVRLKVDSQEHDKLCRQDELMVRSAWDRDVCAAGVRVGGKSWKSIPFGDPHQGWFSWRNVGREFLG